jgi:hypothetical protein
MPARTWLRSCPPCVLLSLALLVSQVDARAQNELETAGQPDLPSVRLVDALSLFPNVGALIYVAGPNDFGLPPGIVTPYSGTLTHERAFLVAGHCTAATGGTLLPFITAFVTLSPNARDRSAWREVSGLAYHPSIPPCLHPTTARFTGKIRACSTSASSFCADRSDTLTRRSWRGPGHTNRIELPVNS